MHLVGFIIRIYDDARSKQAVNKSVWHTPLLCVQWKTPDDGKRNCLKHVEFYSQNKFEKLVHLVGFIIRIYHDARLKQAVSKPVWHKPLLCVQWKTPDDGQRNSPKHVEFYSKNKFEKLVHLVGFIIRIYHDVRSHERQTLLEDSGLPICIVVERGWQTPSFRSSAVP